MSIQLAVLASGTGSNLGAILKSIHSGRLEARVRLVLSNKPDAPALDIARDNGIPVWSMGHAQFADREGFDAAMAAAIREAGADTVVLAGYMRLLSAGFIQAFEGRILNIHPSILPSFPGLKGNADAVAYGARITGCTVHFVDEAMDTGPIIIQAAVPIGPNDTEELVISRVHALEHRIYPQALQWLAKGRLSIEGRRVRLRAARFPAADTIGQRGTWAGSQALSPDGPLGPWIVSPPLEEGF